MKSWVGPFVFSNFFVQGRPSLEPPDSKLLLWTGDSKSLSLRLGSTPKVKPSKHLKLKPVEFRVPIPSFHKYSIRFKRKLEKMEGGSK